MIIDCFAGGGGASVVPIMAQKIVEANCSYLKRHERVPNFDYFIQQNGQYRIV